MEAMSQGEDNGENNPIKLERRSLDPCPRCFRQSGLVWEKIPRTAGEIPLWQYQEPLQHFRPPPICMWQLLGEALEGWPWRQRCCTVEFHVECLKKATLAFINDHGKDMG
jgi:hypothetical protein